MAPGMYTKYSPICNRYTGIAPDSRYNGDEKRGYIANVSTRSNHPKQPTHTYKKHTDTFHRLPTAIPKATDTPL